MYVLGLKKYCKKYEIVSEHFEATKHLASFLKLIFIFTL